MCTVHIIMSNINHPKKERFAHARRHLKFAAHLYRLFVQGGRYLLHEHPESASSWQEQCIQEVLRLEGVQKVIRDQCRYGLRAKGTDGDGPAREATVFMTNSLCTTLQLQRRSPNREGDAIHKHIQLDGGKATVAQVYPPGLCRAVCRVLIEQIRVDRNGQYWLMSMEHDDKQKSRELKNVAKQLREKYKTMEDNEDELEVAWDDAFGVTLGPQQVRRARQEEVDYVKKMELYVVVPIQQCFEKIGKAPITTRLIGINKGDQGSPNYRSRLVAREINTYKRDDLFAAIIISIEANNANGSNSQ